jgi:hypothetical protein
MGAKNRVLRSINNDDASLCVDIFLRPNGTFGFEEYRRDFEDPRGWFPIGAQPMAIFYSEDTALQAAKVHVAWLRTVVNV